MLTLELIIDDYVATASRAVAAFFTHYKIDTLLFAKAERPFPHVGRLDKKGIKRYAFHGAGLAVKFTDGSDVDFDFPNTPTFRYDAFDLWRLEQFVKSNNLKYGAYNAATIAEDFNALIANNRIVKVDDRLYVKSRSHS